MTRPVLAAVLALAMGWSIGCDDDDVPPLVGAMCMPENIPGSGFNPLESYLETSSVQCATRVCGVFGLDGDPQVSLEECLADGGDAGACEDAPPASEIEGRVYCTCRCATETEGASTCECPSGFVCQELLGPEAGPGIAGSYCVREGYPAP